MISISITDTDNIAPLITLADEENGVKENDKARVFREMFENLIAAWRDIREGRSGYAAAYEEA